MLPFTTDQILHSKTSVFLWALLIGDFCFILLHVVMTLNSQIQNYPLCSVAKDGGYAERFQYLKELAVIFLFISVYMKTRGKGFIAWAGLFGYLLSDDALQIHEHLGSFIAARLDIAAHFGIRAIDFGEFAVSAIFGSALLGMIGWFYLRGSETFKQATRHLVLLLIGLACLGVFLDTLHFIYEVGWKFSLVMVILEDGGEMIIMSLIAWYVFLLNGRNGETRHSVKQKGVRKRA